jgi:hypothetical protein
MDIDINQDDRDLIEELCDYDEGLTLWEINFIDEMGRWLAGYPELTVAQRDKAKEILARMESR